jgi:hypothetical protein
MLLQKAALGILFLIDAEDAGAPKRPCAREQSEGFQIRPHTIDGIDDLPSEIVLIHR